jgi:tetratricopeptide (TPR) repeat protein
VSELRERLKSIHDKIELYLSVHRYQAAEKLLQDALKEHGQLANLFNLLGVTYHQQSKFDDAIAAFQKAQDVNPRFIEASLNLAICYADLGLYDDAETTYRQAQDQVHQQETQLSSLITGRLANLHNQTAQAYEQAGLMQEALNEYEKALQLYPQMPDIRFRVASLERQSGRRDRAKSHLLEHERRFPPDPAVYNLLGLLAFEDGDFVTARNRWLKSQDLNPEDRLSSSFLRCLDQTPQNR